MELSTITLNWRGEAWQPNWDMENKERTQEETPEPSEEMETSTEYGYYV